MTVNRATRLLARRATLRRCGRLAVALVLASTLVGTALAYFMASGSATASASVGSLSAPTITGATPGAGTVALSWSTVPAPAGGTVTYYVTRVGGTVGGNCPSSAATATASTSCTDSGLAKGTYTYTVTAVWQSWTATGASSQVSVSFGQLDHFSVTVPPTATAGAAFSVTLTAQDVGNNTVTSYAGSQAIAFSGPSSSPNNTAPSYPATVTFSNGAGTASITLYDAQTTTLTAAQGSVTGTSASFTVNAGANHQIGASASSPQTAGSAFNVALTAQDSWANPTGSLSGTKSVSFSGPSRSPNNTAPVYPATVTFAAGTATASVTLFDAQTTTITATDTTDSLGGTASGNVAVNAAGASAFTVPTPPAQAAGTAFNVTLTAFDAYGNTATGYAGSKSVAFTGPSNSPNNTAPTYPASVTFSSGVGTASITLVDVQSTTLTATQGSVSGSSGSFTVSAGAVNRFGFTSTAVSGATSATANLGPITVQEQDAYGNPTTTAETVSLSSSSAKGVFSTSQFGASVTSVIIPAGQSSANFYYGDQNAGTPTITASKAGLTSGTQQETITAAPAGLGIALAPGSTGTPSISCGAPSTSYTCAVTGVGNGGHVVFYATFVNSSGTQVVYSSTQSSTITESGHDTGSVTIAAGTSSSSPSTLTASHNGASTKTSTLTFGPYTLTITVSS